MISILECCRKHSIQLKHIKRWNNYIILYGENGDYLLKEKGNNKEKLYSTFESIHYPYYLPLISSNKDSYELYPYFEEEVYDNNIKSKEFLKGLILLHKESIYYDEISDIYIKEFYNKIKKDIEEQFQFYLNLQNNIEVEGFPRLDYYYFLLNVSSFYKILTIALDKLELWKNLEIKKVRKALVIHKDSLSNFSYSSKKCYFIDFSECSHDLLIKDFISFYQANLFHTDMIECFHIYQSYLSFSYDEKVLFFCLISIPIKVTFTDNIYQNIIVIQNRVNYIEKTLQFLLEEDKENQKTDEEEFK